MRILAMILVVVGVSTLAFAQTRPVLQTFTSEKHGFKIQYLSIWNTTSPGSQPWIAVSFTPPDDSERQVRAAVAIPPLTDHKAGDPIKLDDIARTLVSELKADTPDVKLVVAADVRLGGEPARRMILTGRSDKANANLKILVVAAAHNGEAYVVGVMAPEEEFDKSRAGFDELIGTFQFIPKK